MKKMDQNTTKVVDRLTRIFCWFFRSTVECKSTYEFRNDEEIEVYWFSEQSDVFAQNTPFDTIIANKKSVESLSQDAKELIFIHELSHNRRSSHFRGIWWGTVILGCVGLALLTWLGILVSLGANVPMTPTTLGLPLLCVSVFVISNRIEELVADLSALQVLGKDAFLNSYEEISEASRSPSLPGKVLLFLFYTDPNTTVRLASMLNIYTTNSRLK